MAQTAERRVKHIIIEWLREHDIYEFRPVQTGYGGTTLDYLTCWRGHFVALEAKAGTKVTARQEAIMREIYRTGGTSWVVGSEIDKNPSKESIIAKLEEIDAFLRSGAKSVDLPD